MRQGLPRETDFNYFGASFLCASRTSVIERDTGRVTLVFCFRLLSYICVCVCVRPSNAGIVIGHRDRSRLRSLPLTRFNHR